MASNPNELALASDNIETVAHYYEGCALQLELELDETVRMDYVRNKEEVHSLDISLYKYTWGMQKMGCPKDAVWYSLSGKYIVKHLILIKEIFPDLYQFNEE